MSALQKEVKVLGEWAMSLPPSLGLSLVASGVGVGEWVGCPFGLIALTTAVGSGTGGQVAPPGSPEASLWALPWRLGEVSD